MKIPKPTDPEDESAWRAFLRACERHHESLRGRVPEHALALLKLKGIDDGLLVEADYNRAERTLKVVLRCGHLQMGYYDLVLQFHDAELSPRNRRVLRLIADTTQSCGVYEFDLYRFELDLASDGALILRMEFWGFHFPDMWVEIRCRTFEWHTEPRPNRELPNIPRCRER
jgi:hypothetical protein